MSDGVIGSCGNEGRGGVEVDIFRRVLEGPDTGSVARNHGKEEARAGLLVLSYKQLGARVLSLPVQSFRTSQ